VGTLAPVSVDLCGLRDGASVVRRCETTRPHGNTQHHRHLPSLAKLTRDWRDYWTDELIDE